MSAPFDPYHQWLGITPAEQPANYYRLLGLQTFEPNAQVIAQAAQQTSAHLANFAVAPSDALSQRLLNEVAAAQACLLHPVRRAAYDEYLRSMLQPELPPSTVPVARPSSQLRGGDRAPTGQIEFPADNSDFEESVTRSAPPARRNGNLSALINICGHVVASVLGLAIGYVILCWLRPELDKFGIFTADLPPRPATAAPQPQQPVEPTVPLPAARAPATPSTVTAPLPARPISAVPDPVAATFEQPKLPARPTQVAAAAQPPMVQPTGILDTLPAGVQLPPVDQVEPVELLQVEVPADLELELGLLSDALPEHDNARFLLRLTHARVGDYRWSVTLGEVTEVDVVSKEKSAIPVAELALKQTRLLFRWLSAASDVPIGRLRNCLLQLRLGSHQKLVALRRAQPLPAIGLELEDRVQLQPLEIADLPPLEQVKFEVTRLDGFPVDHIYQSDPRVTFGEKVEIRLSAEPLVQLTLLTSDRSSGPTLTVSGTYRLTGDRDFPLAKEKAEVQLVALQKQYLTASNELPARIKEQGRLASQLRTIATRPIPNTAAAGAMQFQKSEQLKAANSAIQKNERRIGSLRKELPQLEQSLKALQLVGLLHSQLSGRAVVHYRLLCSCAGQDVVLAETSSTATLAAGK